MADPKDVELAIAVAEHKEAAGGPHARAYAEVAAALRLVAELKRSGGWRLSPPGERRYLAAPGHVQDAYAAE